MSSEFNSETIYSGISDALESLNPNHQTKAIEVIADLAECCATSLNMLIVAMGMSREVANSLNRLDECWYWATCQMRNVYESQQNKSEGEQEQE